MLHTTTSLTKKPSHFNLIPKTKEEAEASRLLFYSSGELCARRHIAVRRVDSGGCVMCNRIRVKEWKEARTKVSRKSDRKVVEVTHVESGQTYPSMRAAAEAFGVSLSSVWWSINHHLRPHLQKEVKGHVFTKRVYRQQYQ